MSWKGLGSRETIKIVQAHIGQSGWHLLRANFCMIFVSMYFNRNNVVAQERGAACGKGVPRPLVQSRRNAN